MRNNKDSLSNDDGATICQYISGFTARKYLNCSKGKFESLVEQGLIEAHRDKERRWRVSKASILDYIRQSQMSAETHLITNENHYDVVIKRICSAKSSIKIMTANFKRFRLKPEPNQGNDYSDGTPFIKYLMEKAVQGVHVQIICSRPSSSFTEEWEDYYNQMEPELFEYMFCERNHSKMIIIDDKIAYVGSANVTPAGLGQGIFTPGNFEVGIITENKDVVTSAIDYFSMIWDEKFCATCHRADKCNDCEE